MTHLQQARQLLTRGKQEFERFFKENAGGSPFVSPAQGKPSAWVAYMKGTAMPINRDVAYHLSFVYPTWDETPAVVLEFFWYVRSYDELIAQWEEGTLDANYFPTIGRNFPASLDRFLATE